MVLSSAGWLFWQFYLKRLTGLQILGGPVEARDSKWACSQGLSLKKNDQRAEMSLVSQAIIPSFLTQGLQSKTTRLQGLELPYTISLPSYWSEKVTRVGEIQGSKRSSSLLGEQYTIQQKCVDTQSRSINIQQPHQEQPVPYLVFVFISGSQIFPYPIPIRVDITLDNDILKSLVLYLDCEFLILSLGHSTEPGTSRIFLNIK